MNVSNSAKRFIQIVLCLGFVGCASTTKERILRDMTIAAALGAAAGQAEKENQAAYSVMYSGVAAAVTAAAELWLLDPDAETEKYRTETKNLRKDLDEAFSPKVSAKVPATFNAKVPEKYRRLINPGEWRLSEIDQWIEDSENRLIHQDKIMELVPPSLNPNSFPVSKKKEDK